MKFGELRTHEALLDDQLRADPEFRSAWERTALARAVAVALVRYRAEKGLSQREVGEILGMRQPQVARLEAGEVNPSVEMLMRISAGLGLELTIDVRPAKAEPRLVTEEARREHRVGGVETAGAELLVAVALA